VSDGWTSIQCKPIINIPVVSNKGASFLKTLLLYSICSCTFKFYTWKQHFKICQLPTFCDDSICSHCQQDSFSFCQCTSNWRFANADADWVMQEQCVTDRGLKCSVRSITLGYCLFAVLFFSSNDDNDVNSHRISDFVFVDKIFAMWEHCTLWLHLQDTPANKKQSFMCNMHFKNFLPFHALTSEYSSNESVITTGTNTGQHL